VARRGLAVRIGRGALLFAAALVTLFPFYAMLVLSLKPAGPMTFPGSLLPWPVSVEGYQQVLGGRSVLTWAFNTLVYSVLSVAGFMLVWFIAAEIAQSRLLPGPGAVLAYIYQEGVHGDLLAI